jgi:HSP20 family protein
MDRRHYLASDSDLQLVFERLRETDPGALSADCTPPLDVVETAGGIEVVLDVPGVALQDVTIAFVHNALVIMGRKRAGACEHRGAAFHLAERGFGRFARAVRLTGAFDAGRADATLRAGELRVTLPRIDDRRGAEIRIPVRAD